jgi:hypothetical protein
MKSIAPISASHRVGLLQHLQGGSHREVLQGNILPKPVFPLPGHRVILLDQIRVNKALRVVLKSLELAAEKKRRIDLTVYQRKMKPFKTKDPWCGSFCLMA